MKKRRVFLSLIICLAAAFFACGIFAIFNTKDKRQTVTAEAATAVTPTIYWRYTGSSTTLELSSSQLTGGTETGSFSGDTIFKNTMEQPWYNYREQITTANILNPISPVSTANWFRICRNLQKVENIRNLDTSNAETLQGMFAGCNTLPKIDVSGFDTSNVIHMGQMFSGCHALSEIDVSGFDTSNVWDFGSMFGDCKALKKIDVSNFDTSKAIAINNMFSGCLLIETLDLYNFDCSSIGPFDEYNLSEMFNNMPALKKLKLSDSLAGTISSVTDAKYGVGIALPLYYQDGTTCNTERKMSKGGGYFKTMHSHTYDSAPSSVDEATCSDTGTKYFDCQESFCTYVKQETIPANGQHSFTNYVSNNNATCTADGTKTATCDNCTATETVTDTGTATGHSTTYNAPNAPNCVTAGTVAYYYCSKCNKNFDDSVGTNELTTIVDPATGVHSFT
ncbi:MAG: DUF285 domain-containing protein, partial [Clostridia bacterium]|nr:DUF285 domain-containing protein [Clostridia bacterium]